MVSEGRLAAHSLDRIAVLRISSYSHQLIDLPCLRKGDDQDEARVELVRSPSADQIEVVDDSNLRGKLAGWHIEAEVVMIVEPIGDTIAIDGCSDYNVVC